MRAPGTSQQPYRRQSRQPAPQQPAQPQPAQQQAFQKQPAQPQPAPQQAYQPQPAPQQAYQPQPAPQQTYQPQSAPQQAYQPQPAPQQAYQLQPAQQQAPPQQPGRMQPGSLLPGGQATGSQIFGTNPGERRQASSNVDAGQQRRSHSNQRQRQSGQRQLDQRQSGQRQLDQRQSGQRQLDQRQSGQRQLDQRQSGQEQPDQRQQSRREYGFSPSGSSSGNWRKDTGSRIPTLSGRRQDWRDSQDRSKKWQAKREANKTRKQEMKVNETNPKKTGITFSTTSKQFITSNMLPGDKWWIQDGNVNFREGNFLCTFPAELPDERILRKKSVVHPTRPCLIVDNMRTTTLPEPSRSMGPQLKEHPWLHLKPKILSCSNHFGGGEECSCVQMGLSGQYHRPAVLSDVCIREGLMRPFDLTVKPMGLQTQENPQRFYLHHKEVDDHLLGVPTPFLISGQWPEKHFLPAMAQEGSDNVTRLYYALYDSSRFRQMAEIYSKPPQEWPGEHNPILGEPAPNGELGKVVKGLYGLETLQRVGFAAHPCSEPRVLLYCAVTPSDKRVPILVTDRASPMRLDAAITEVIRPWYDQGQGKIVCSVCLIQADSSGRAALLFLSRAEYIHHWEAEHSSALVATSVFSATQLHVRIHVGHLAYVLALANRLKGQESPKGTAVSSTALRQFGITEHDEVLKAFLGPPSNEEMDDLLSEVMDPPDAEGQCGQEAKPGRFLIPKNKKK